MASKEEKQAKKAEELNMKRQSKAEELRMKRLSKLVHGKLPVKKSINLLPINENRIDPLKAIPSIVLIVLAAAAFSKFMVYDKMTAASDAQAQVAKVQATLDDLNQKLVEIGDVENAYAHYTMDGMTSAELGLVDRIQILDMVVEYLPHDEGISTAWNVSGNTLTVQLEGDTLQDLNVLARTIEKSPIVNRCVITQANKNIIDQNGDTIVRSSFIIYLQKASESGEEDAEGGSNASGRGNGRSGTNETEADGANFVSDLGAVTTFLRGNTELNGVYDDPSSLDNSTGGGSQTGTSNDAADWARGFIRGVD